MDNRWDIVVVGCGPAGAMAARSAAAAGAKVVLVDRKEIVGVPVRCAELVPRMIARYVPFSPACVRQTIEKLRLHIDRSRCIEMKSPGFVLDRALFDQELSASAVEAGAKLLLGTRAIARLPEGILAERNGNSLILRCRVIIGADGSGSIVSRWIGNAPWKRIFALQYEVDLPDTADKAEIFFDHRFEGGYGWFFPKGKTANVGIGVLPQRVSSLRQLLEEFVRYLAGTGRLRYLRILRKKAGTIPCQFPGKTVEGNVVLVGDAASQAHPVTGAGVANALIAGKLAGEIATQAIMKDDLRLLKGYEDAWRDAFGTSLFYGAKKRDFFERHWHDSELDFERLIRTTWSGFKEYYRERIMQGHQLFEYSG